MASMLDVIGSFVVGGLIVIMMLGFKADLSTTADSHYFNQSIQENLRSLTDVLEHDFRKMGYAVSSANKIKSVNDSTIVFYGNVDNQGGYDSIQYYFRSVKPAGAHNQSVGTLYRVLNDQPPQPIRLGVTRFQLLWCDKDGTIKPSVLANVRSVKVSLTVESDSPIDSVKDGASWRNVYSGVTWERTIRPKNLR